MAFPFWLKKTCVRLGLARLMPAVKRHTDGDTSYANYFSDRILAAPLDDLLDPTAFPQLVADDVLNLNLAAPRYDTAYERGSGGSKSTADYGVHGSRELRKTIADLTRIRHGIALEPDEQVLTTHGAMGAYASALDAIINPGDGIVLFDPSSPMFHIGAKSRRAKLRWVPTWNEDGRSRFLMEGLARAMRGAKMLVLANPSNPTGGVLGCEEWERIAWLAKRQNVLVYADESFGRYSYGETVRLPAEADFRKRLLVAGSVSQTYGMGSSRVGWLTGPKQLVAACKLTQVLTTPFIPAACQAAALRALQTPEELFRPTIGQFSKRRRYAFDRLKGMGLEPHWPDGGFTLWVNAANLGIESRALVERLLREERILVGNGEVYGPSGKGHIRISYAVEEGRLREGLNRMGAFVDRLKGTSTVRIEPLAIASVEHDVQELAPAFSRG